MNVCCIYTVCVMIVMCVLLVVRLHWRWSSGVRRRSLLRWWRPSSDALSPTGGVPCRVAPADAVRPRAHALSPFSPGYTLSRSASAPTPRSISEPASVFHRHLLPPRSLLAPSTIDPSAPPPHCSLMYHPLSLSLTPPWHPGVCVYESYTVRGSLSLPISLSLSASLFLSAWDTRALPVCTHHYGCVRCYLPFLLASTPHHIPFTNSVRLFPNATQIVYNFRKTVNTHT